MLLGMDFPILTLIDNESATDWLLTHFHPDGLTCPHCDADVDKARIFQQTTTSHLITYRCLCCDGIYNLYSGTVFQQKRLTPAQAVLLLRGVCQGTPTAQLAREIGLSRPTVHSIRHAIQANAQALQPSRRQTDRDGRDVPKRGGKKVTRISTHQTHPVAVPISAGGEGLMPMTVPRYLARSVVRVVK